jgi:hypothetical protein
LQSLATDVNRQLAGLSGLMLLSEEPVEELRIATEHGDADFHRLMELTGMEAPFSVGGPTRQPSQFPPESQEWHEAVGRIQTNYKVFSQQIGAVLVFAQAGDNQASVELARRTDEQGAARELVAVIGRSIEQCKRQVERDENQMRLNAKRFRTQAVMGGSATIALAAFAYWLLMCFCKRTQQTLNHTGDNPSPAGKLE